VEQAHLEILELAERLATQAIQGSVEVEATLLRQLKLGLGDMEV
jgi:hypothetical protein